MSNGSDDDKATRPVGPTRVEVRPKQRNAPTPTDPAATHRVGSEEPSESRAPAASSGGEQGRTVIYGGGRAAPASAPEEPSPKATVVPRPEADQGPAHPVVGWFVVLSGPGRGRAVAMFEGMNSAGRGPSERIRLDFGDDSISREAHFLATYDPRRRTFHVHHGGRINLVYVNGDSLLEAKLLASGDVIEVGATKLRFVALCGPDFSWDEHP